MCSILGTDRPTVCDIDHFGARISGNSDSSCTIKRYHQGRMRQLIARIDDSLHEELKARAAAEGRSMNSVVTELLTSGLAVSDQRKIIEARAVAEGLLVVPRQQRRAPSRKAAISSTRGMGPTASKALEAERSRARW